MIRHDVLKGLRDATELTEAAGRRMTTRDSALLGARVALESAMASVKKIRIVPSSPHEKHIAQLLLARISKHLIDLKREVDRDPS